MKPNNDFNKNTHIDAIRRQLGIALGTISRYNSEHRDEIKHIGDIFCLKNSSKEKVLVLLFMLSFFEKDNAVQKYCEQTNLNNAEYDPATLLDQYKILLLTALVYENTFYAMAINYRESINAGLAVGEIEENSTNSSIANSGKIIPFSVTRSRFIKNSQKYLAAAASLAAVVFFTMLIRINTGYGSQVNNAWVSSLKEPEKAINGITYNAGEVNSVRIGLLSPLLDKAMWIKNEAPDNGSTIDYYTKAIRRDNKNADLYVNRGVAYTIGGYLDSAVKDFNKAIKLDPKNASAYYNRAIANAGKNIEQDAIINDLETAISINPGDKDAYYAIGVFYYRQYDNDENKQEALLEAAINSFKNIPGYKDTDTIMDIINIK